MKDSQPQTSRRGFFVGAATAGVAAGAVALLPQVPDTKPAAEQAGPTPERGGGYHLSVHVRRYYKTTLV